MDIKKIASFSQIFKEKYFNTETAKEYKKYTDEKIRELAKISAENKDCLIANYIQENPETPISDIMLIEDRTNPFKTYFYVTKRSL